MPGISSIGKMDRRITFQQEVSANNEFNEIEVSGWEDVVTVWAQVQDEDSTVNREAYISDQMTALRTLNFIIRYRTGLTEKMRIEYNGQYFGIRAIVEPDRRKSLIVKATLLDET